MYLVVKITVSALVIGVVTMLAKVSPKYGGIVAALPLVSLLSLIWLAVEGEKTKELSQFLFGVIYGLPATGFLVLIVAISLKSSIPIAYSIGFGVIGWMGFLYFQQLLLKM